MPIELNSYERRMGLEAEYLEELESDEIGQPGLPGELTEDYLEAKRRMEEYLKMAEDALTIFDDMYWVILFDNMWVFLQDWSTWLQGKLWIVGVALFASIAAGSICTFFIYLMLTWFGPVRIKKLGLLLIVLIIGSIFVTGSIELAVASVLGIVFLSFTSFLKISTGCELKGGVLISEKGAPPVIIALEFWYVGKRVLWFNLSKGYVGLYSI